MDYYCEEGVQKSSHWSYVDAYLSAFLRKSYPSSFQTLPYFYMVFEYVVVFSRPLRAPYVF